VHSDDTARALAGALRKDGIYGIRIEVSAYRVWLTGSVSSVRHKDRALELAGSMPGVSSVRAEIARHHAGERRT
jgi:osmotically-inducible protein OsmY